MEAHITRRSETPRLNLVSLAVAAAILDTSTKTVRRRIADGTLCGYRIGGRGAIKVDEGAVFALITPIPTVTAR